MSVCLLLSNDGIGDDEIEGIFDDVEDAKCHIEKIKHDYRMNHDSSNDDSSFVIQIWKINSTTPLKSEYVIPE